MHGHTAWTGVDRPRLRALLASEREAYARHHPRSQAFTSEARGLLMAGVPMTWMIRWPGGFPIYFAHAQGNRLKDVDGHEYLDFCLGDSAAIAGHGDLTITRAVAERYERGATAMLPTADALWVAAELRRRFGLKVWQFTTSASDANRWVLRMARQVTGRPKIVVINGCYHGTVDETVVWMDKTGETRSRPGNLGPAIDPAFTTRVVEWNDPDALRLALATGDVAAVIAEPVMTNAGMVQPARGYHQAIRDLTRASGTWLVLDETQTWAAGPGGCTQAMELEPDVVTLGKGMAGGIAIGTFGLRTELSEAVLESGADLEDGGSVGGTLAANALSLAAARVTLEQVLTDAVFRRMVRLADDYVARIRALLAERGLPWYITSVGARAEYGFCPPFPRNGSDSRRAEDDELDGYLHLALLNRGVLQTPFHNMVLIGAPTTVHDVDRLVEILGEIIDALLIRPGRRRIARAQPGNGQPRA